MKRQITVFITIVILLSLGRQTCLSNDCSLEKKEFLKKICSSYENRPDTSFPCPLSIQDTSVIGICLENAESTIKVIGENYKFYGMMDDSIFRFPHACINSSDNKQILYLVFFPGGKKHAYSEFIIKYNTDNIRNRTIDKKEFITSRQVKLGKTRKEIVELFGDCYKIEKVNNHLERILYYVDVNSKSKFLWRYNMPAYHLDFEFTDGKLTKYIFGFVNP